MTSLLEIIDVVCEKTQTAIYILVSFKTMKKPTYIQTIKLARSSDRNWYMISKIDHRYEVRKYYDFLVKDDRTQLEKSVQYADEDKVHLEEYVRITKEVLAHPRVQKWTKQ